MRRWIRQSGNYGCGAGAGYTSTFRKITFKLLASAGNPEKRASRALEAEGEGRGKEQKKELESSGGCWHPTRIAPAEPLPAKQVMPIPAGILLDKETYNKPALSHEQQLDEKLIPRGLVVEDRSRALKWLRRIGYYRLSGYLYPFRVSPMDDNFRPGVTFDAAIVIYKFDCHLRLLILQAIDRIEIGMRGSVTYHLGHELGPFGHMNPEIFVPFAPKTADTPAKGLDFQSFRDRIASDEKQSSEVFVKHYREKYSNPDLPIWMLTEIISIGTLARITKNLRDKEIQRKIARDFALSQSQLLSWMGTLGYIRNVCAHHGRLWNRTISMKPELLSSWRAKDVTRDRLYVVLLMLLHLMEQVAPRSHWKHRLMAHLLNDEHIDLGPMKFPDEWYRLEPWDSVGPL
jgi:abortive infection bacteriophage resistance protein